MKESLSERLYLCSIIGMNDGQKVERLLLELLGCDDKKELEKIVNNPNIDLLFKTIAKDKLVIVDLPALLKGRKAKIHIETEVPLDTFSPAVRHAIKTSKIPQSSTVKIEIKNNSICIKAFREMIIGEELNTKELFTNGFCNN